MTTALEPVRPITLSEIKDARARIAGTIVRTPLVRLELGSGFPDVRLKLENLQPINAYKLRGAANAVALLSDAERRRGVWTIRAGNAGQGVAYAARAAGVACTAVAIETAPAAKLQRMRALAAKLVRVPYAVAWQALADRSYTRVDGAGGKSVFPRMWQRMQPVVDGFVVVTLDEVKRAMRLMAEKARVIAEGAGALGLAAALTGKAGKGPVVAIVSGGNIDLEKFSELIA